MYKNYQEFVAILCHAHIILHVKNLTTIVFNKYSRCEIPFSKIDQNNKEFLESLRIFLKCQGDNKSAFQTFFNLSLI